MKHLKEQPKSEHELELAGPFFAVLFVLMLIGFLVPLRPEYSDRERRKLLCDIKNKKKSGDLEKWQKQYHNV